MTTSTTALTRRQAREVAFQFLYGHLPEKSMAVTFERSDFEHFCSNFSQTVDEFAWALCEGTGQNVPSLDEAIAKLSTNWRLERMPRVDLTILRMAAFEVLKRTDIPKTVAINEAVELAKRFGAEDSAAFVNGILDKLDRPAG